MKRLIPVIVLSQFFCTSLWFAGNAVLHDLVPDANTANLANLTSAVQFGFIAGTFVFALFTVSDRFSPVSVFFTCAIIAAFLNLGIVLPGLSPEKLMWCRFGVGFFLAGIYPVGMKIASDHFKEGLGLSLGFLVGALVLGTGFPHLLKSFTSSLSWQKVIYGTSLLSATGGCMMLLFVKDGPYRRAGKKQQLSALIAGFRKKELRKAAMGYFGHMWELYAFWAFVPPMLLSNVEHYHRAGTDVSVLSFLIIASGGLACVAGGLLSRRFGVKRVAAISLALSGLCCLMSPFFLLHDSLTVLVLFLFFWGLVVVADSPLFSTLVALNAPAEARGSVLTIINCVGFSITIFSIQLLKILSKELEAHYLYVVLAFGPLCGLMSMYGRKKTSATTVRPVSEKIQQ